MALISGMFALAARMSDVREIIRLHKKNKSDNTKMIDLLRDVADDIGLLDQMPDKLEVPAPLKQYDFKWVQKTLNKLQGAGLRVDGDIGEKGSKTRTAVEKFQKEHPPLHVDGIPGLQTITVMQMALEKLEGDLKA